MEEIYTHSGTQGVSPMPPERRKHRRLQMHLPLEFRRVAESNTQRCRSVTQDVSTGGIYFETMQEGLHKGELLDIEMTIPPGEGHFPYQGRVSSVATVVRTDKHDGSAGATSNPRMGIGVAFRESFKLSF